MAELSTLELEAGVAIVAAGISMFGGFLPGLSDLLGDAQTDGMRGCLDFGQPAAALATVAVGVVLSFATKSIMPTLFALGISAALWLVYELAFQRMM